MLKSVLSRRIVVGIIGGVSGGASATAVTGLSHSEHSVIDPMGYIADNYMKFFKDTQTLALASEKEIEVIDDSKSVATSEYCMPSREGSVVRDHDADDYSEVRSEITTSSTSEIFEADPTCFRSLAQFNSLIANTIVLDSPPRREEVLGAIETIWAPPAALQPFIPQVLQRLSEEQKTEVSTRIFNAVMSPEVMQALQRNIAAHEEEAIQSQPKFFHLPQQTHPDFEKWEELVAKYRCAICLDVLAAPHVTDCSHTYCWACITEEGNKKYPHCGLCNDKVTSLNYSRNEDSNICAEVQKISDSYLSKMDWNERRMKFIHKRKGKNDVVLEELIIKWEFWVGVLAGFALCLVACKRKWI